jgi:hypothetical protein
MEVQYEQEVQKYLEDRVRRRDEAIKTVHNKHKELFSRLAEVGINPIELASYLSELSAASR